MADHPQWVDDESSPEISIDTVPIRVPREEDPPSSLLAEKFGKYLIVGELEMGGMAELFLGIHRGLEGFVKVVVIKRVLPQFADNAAFIRMFIDEARLAARLEHANIVRTYEFGEVDGQYFTVMEYLPGEDLSKVLNRFVVSRQHMPFGMAATIVSQVCSGLHFAHELTDTDGRPLNLVHRDVNPSNIILTYSGDVKLIDFGVATTAQHAKTATGTIKGKLAYMSPEHLLARGVDRRSDVFAAGIVLWELLAGRPLFVRDSEAATLYAIMNDPIPPVRRFRSDVPAELEEIVMRALARPICDRYESAEEMQVALDVFLQGHGGCDTRARARMLEDLFGSTRAEAKRSIAQARALATNVSLVMKLRSEKRSDLADLVDALARDADGDADDDGTADAGTEAPFEERAGASRVPLIAVALVVLLAIGGGLGFVLRSSPAAGTPAAAAAGMVRGSVTIESSPPGAAISIGGEPSGLKTPATLSGITAPTITVALELPGHEPRSATIEVPASGTSTEHFVLAFDQKEGSP